MTDRRTAIGLALVAGVSGALQPKVNAALGDRVGSSLVASLVNFAVASACVAVVLAVRPTTRARLRRWREWGVPWWTALAGLGGAVAVVVGVVAVERIGVATMSVAFFSGQLVNSLLVDALGFGPRGRQAVTPGRLQAAGLALAAVVVAQMGGDRRAEFEPLLVLLVLCAGALVAFQVACNGRVTAVTGDAAAATALNVAVGLLALTVVTTAVGVAGRLPDLALPAPPWLYGGGALGATIVLTMAASTASVGVLRSTVGMLAAQLVTAFVIDWIADGTVPAVGAVVGAALVVAAVVRSNQREPVPARQG